MTTDKPTNLSSLGRQQKERGAAVGTWIRTGRAAKGWTQKELSEKSGIPETTISTFENNGKRGEKIQIAKEEQIHALAHALEIDEDLGRAAAGFAPLEAARVVQNLVLQNGDFLFLRTASGRPLPVNEDLLRRLEVEIEIMESREQKH